VILAATVIAALSLPELETKFLKEYARSSIYIDAYIPENGDSCWKLTSEIYRDLFIAGASYNGYTLGVPFGTDNRRVPHPLATFMQSIKLLDNYKKIQNLTLIYASGWEATPFKNQFEARKNSPDWHIELKRLLTRCPTSYTD